MIEADLLRRLHDANDDCIRIAAQEYGLQLDGSLKSLTAADQLCAQVGKHAPMMDERLDRWVDLIGAYTGGVLCRAFGGDWIQDEEDGWAVSIASGKVVMFVRSFVRRVLGGDPYRSLASLEVHIGHALETSDARQVDP